MSLAQIFVKKAGKPHWENRVQAKHQKVKKDGVFEKQPDLVKDQNVKKLRVRAYILYKESKV